MSKTHPKGGRKGGGLLTLGDSDVLQKEDDSRDGKFACDGGEEVQFEAGLLDMLEARGDGEQDLDGVLAVGQLPGAAVKE